MKSVRMFLAGAGLALLAGLAYVAQREDATSGAKMVGAAKSFFNSLQPEQKAKVAFDFDSKERTNWNFVPLQDKAKKSTRKGLPLEDMTAEQKKLALALVQAGTSKSGAEAATAIMELEAILKEQEKGGAMVRNPQWYFFTIFGTPSTTGKWGWRVEGHHLSLNFTMEGDQVIASSPAFFGANPAEVKAGAKKGLRVLASAEDLAADLFRSLTADQKKVAHQAKDFGEPGQKTIKPNLGKPVGVAASDLNEKQRDILRKLIESYAARMPGDIAAEELKRVKDGGFDKIHFAYSGEPALGKAYTYRVHGPLFVVEFLNIQADSAGNPANHIHSAWRRTSGDFGMP